MPYAELFCFTNFSFLKGASHPEELVQQAKSLGYRALAITDECSLAGVVRAHLQAEQNGLPLIIGSYFESIEGVNFIALAPDKQAYQQLSSYISQTRRRSEKGEYLAQLRDLDRHLRDCLLIWLPTLPLQAPLSTPASTSQPPSPANAPTAAQQPGFPPADIAAFLQATRQRLWVGLENDLTAESALLLPYRMELADHLQLPVVACGGVLMHIAERKPLQDMLTATRLSTCIDDAGFDLHANRERYLQPLVHLRARLPARALQETDAIADRCVFSLRQLRYQYPHELVPSHLTPTQYLRQLTEAGARQRWSDGIKPAVQRQIDKELAVIAELEYEYYFLTVHDIVQFARSHHILCQGRGSAANSAVCFCLFITEVDPAVHHLLFERFISKERNEPPDIDVDFEHERREEVIQFIYKKYGRKRAALTATVITYRLKSALRDVGKALGFDQALLDGLDSVMAWWDKPEQLPERLISIGLDPRSHRVQQFLSLVNTVLGFPRHLSQHVGGFIIASGDLDQIVPIENASMPDRTVVQWDKDDIEALGLMKIDILALGMLSAIRRSFDLIESLRGIRWSMATLPQEVPGVYQMLQNADTIGVFQVESRAQMSMLPRLKPACMYDLVIQVAIVRPGPIQGDMVHPYLRRRQGLEAVDYPGEAVRGILERTLGVPIFQEQVIELAMVAAGFTAGEADQLRRAMAAWKKKGGLEPYQEKLTRGLLERGYSDAFAARIVEQIKGFGEYGFPESHAASFALLAYVSSWLKYAEPAAFCCALLNSQPMGFYSPSQLVQDVRRHGIEVRPIDVCHSHWECHLEPLPGQAQPALRLGLCLLKTLSRQGGETLLKARRQQGFRSLADLQQRTHLHQRDLDALAHGNALRGLAGHRYQARWESLALKAPTPLVHAVNERDVTVVLSAPTEGQDTVEDYSSQGLTLGRHPLAQLRRHPRLKGCKTQREIEQLSPKRFVQVAGIVTCRQRPGTATGVVFLTLEDETGNSNIVVWRDVSERFRREILDGRLLKIKGVVERESQVTHVIAGVIEDVSELLGELSLASRDFH